MISAAEITEGTDSESEIQATFEYEVDGMPFEAVDYLKDFDESRKIPARWRAGQSATVYYDPEDPGRGVLYPGDHWQTVMLCIVGSIPILITMPFLIYWAAMRYASYKLSVARYHLAEAQRLIQEGNALVAADTRERGYSDEELAERQREVQAQAAEVEKLVGGLEAEMADEETPGEKPE
jgi:hypothetical protein